MKPYFEEDGITLYCGDCREVLPQIGAEAIITDPVWPNCEHIFPGVEAFSLLQEAIESTRGVHRLVIQLGCNSDPRFLMAVPERYKYFRTCYLEYAVVGYLGRLLRDAEVAYVFGDPPDSVPGSRVIPGRVIATRSNADKGWSNKGRTAEAVAESVAKQQHPTRRLLQHVRWLCRWFGGSSVCDPFAGSGTTGVACKILGIPCTLIEIEERYCELAANRLRQGVLALTEAVL